MKEEYINLKLTSAELCFLKEQLALRQMKIIEEIRKLKEQDKYKNENLLYDLGVDKRTCDKLRKYIEYAMR